MTEVLSELQAGYDQRAQQAAQLPASQRVAGAPGVLQDATQHHFPTRTYTGAALERRRAWGYEYADQLRDRAANRRRKVG